MAYYFGAGATDFYRSKDTAGELPNAEKSAGAASKACLLITSKTAAMMRYRQFASINKFTLTRRIRPARTYESLLSMTATAERIRKWEPDLKLHDWSTCQMTITFDLSDSTISDETLDEIKQCIGSEDAFFLDRANKKLMITSDDLVFVGEIEGDYTYEDVSKYYKWNNVLLEHSTNNVVSDLLVLYHRGIR